MRIRRFEDIKAWQEARILTKRIYDISKKSLFNRDYGLQDQIRRSAISIMANISEGFGRSSNKDFVKFLDYSSASNCELQSHLYVALDQGYIDKAEFENLYGQSKLTGNLINGFIAYLKKR